MDYLSLVIGVIVILTCFYLVVAPFFTKGESRGNQLESKEPLEDLYRLMNDLEMDLWMKKISQADYEGLKKQYELLAVEHLAFQPLPSEPIKKPKKVKAKVDEEILRELEKMRKRESS